MAASSSSTFYHRLDHATLEVEESNGKEYREEEKEEEYFYIHPRPLSQASESATINFLTDDREEEEARRQGARQWTPTANKAKDWEEYSRRPADENAFRGNVVEGPHTTQHHSTKHTVEVEEEWRGMSKGVDYSPRDFHQARAVIDAAARSNAGPPASNVRVRQVGDTTIVTEHRDPYSFYWQLDQLKKMQKEPPRIIPPADYVIDEDEEEREEDYSPLLQEHSTVLSPDSHDSGVNMESHYSRPQKEEVAHRPLPAGWEKHEDPSGFSYYWHVDSGTIQRDPPPSQRPIIPEEVHPPIDAAQQTIPLQIPAPLPQQPIIEEHAFRQTTTKRRVENQDESSDTETGEKTTSRFMVRSLGWMEISEEELTAERSSRAVNKAILELSSSAHRIPDTEKWGNGKELILGLNDKELTLLDPDNKDVVNKHSIQQIRVWGVGKDNARDFAYVARDKNSGKRFLCHVFRCDSPAKVIANNLKEICKRLMTQRRPASFNTGEFVPEKRIIKESLLLTPIDEPKRIIRCHFIGVTQVPRATGIEVLNEAVDRLVKQVRPDRWVLCDVSIAPSTIVITEQNGNKIAQCRVRYLSFLGIGHDTRRCAFIMHTSPENFMCYVFHVEPTAGTMAKTIEAACKLRYQKVLDAHMNRQSPLLRGLASQHSNGLG